MRYVTVEGAELSVIGLGTWQFGSVEWGYGRAYADEEAGRIVKRALQLGVNFIDTAEIYGFGSSERIVGAAIAGQRDQAFVATKLFPVSPVPPVVRQRARGSARRLGVERIDLYQLHWPNPAVPLGLTMRAMRELVEEGLVRFVGVSNFDLARWRAAEEALGLPVVSNQVRYSLVDRRAEAELLPYAERAGRVVIAYSPLGQGLLSGRYDEANRPGGLRAATREFLPENLRRVRPLLDCLREVAKAHDATCSQVALAWVIRRPNVVAIPGAASVGQLEANVEAASLELTDEEDRALSEASALYRPVGGLQALPYRIPEAGRLVASVGKGLAGRVATIARGRRG
jgi:aryl-alcohol dehydrogenase-like predicted oxidoreductase